MSDLDSDGEDAQETRNDKHPISPNNDEEKRRISTVYDAVAGRVGTNSFISTTSSTTQTLTTRNGFPSLSSTLSPLDVLLRRTSAPTSGRADIYLAGSFPRDAAALPDSDLLKAIHAYAADFYAAIAPDGGICDFRSLDETALIAVGVLVEEAVRKVLGRNGDMVFTEPEGWGQDLEETQETRERVVGCVPRMAVDEPKGGMGRGREGSGSGDGGEEEERPAKRGRFGYF